VVIPAFLREHASLDGDTVVVGVYSRVEIWSKSAWLTERQMFESEGAQLAQVLSISQA
jgi:MraZ protein